MGKTFLAYGETECILFGSKRKLRKINTFQLNVMVQSLLWRPLDQRRIDSRLVMMYKVAYDIVAIPAPEFLEPNRRESKLIHSLAYKHILTSTSYYKYSSYTGTPFQFFKFVGIS